MGRRPGSELERSPGVDRVGGRRASVGWGDGERSRRGRVWRWGSPGERSEGFAGVSVGP